MIVNVHGTEVLIDEEDLAKFNERPWYVASNGYVVSRVKIGHGLHRKGVSTYLHRLVLGYNGPLIVDHINRNPLDNQKKNLRLVTQVENQLNRKNPLQTNNQSGTTGVRFQKGQGWTAYIQRNGKKKHLGTFESRDLAIAARQQAEEL